MLEKAHGHLCTSAQTVWNLIQLMYQKCTYTVLTLTSGTTCQIKKYSYKLVILLLKQLNAMPQAEILYYGEYNFSHFHKHLAISNTVIKDVGLTEIHNLGS